jgi:hypothetical protein
MRKRLLLLFGFVLVAASRSASAVTLQEILRAQHERQVPITIELRDGSTLHGIVLRVHRSTFDLNASGGPAPSPRRTIAYADLRLVTDGTTGERFLVQPSPTAQMPRHHASLKALICVGVIVAALFAVVYLVTPYT